MAKNSSDQIQAGCRVAGYISDTARKNNAIEIFDVLEVTEDRQFRCHKTRTKFDQSNRNVFIKEQQLNWYRLSNGKEFFRKSTEQTWQELNPPIGKTGKSLSESLSPMFKKTSQ